MKNSYVPFTQISPDLPILPHLLFHSPCAHTPLIYLHPLRVGCRWRGPLHLKASVCVSLKEDSRELADTHMQAQHSSQSGGGCWCRTGSKLQTLFRCQWLAQLSSVA